MKLPLNKIKLFSGKSKKAAAQPAEAAPPGAHKKKKRRRLKKRVVIPLAVLAVAGGAFGVHHFLTAGQAEAAPTYSGSAAGRQDTQLTLAATGMIEPANQYDVTSTVQGEVLSCTFEEGDEVKKGDVLYEIDSTDAENSIEQAQLSLQQSQNSYDQTLESMDDLTVTSKKSGMITELYVEVGDEVQAGATIADVRDSSVMATLSSDSVDQQVESSRLSLQQSQLSYQNTVQQLDDYTIAAPIDGTVITKNTKVGDTLDATNGQTTLAVIYDLSYLTFDMSLDELDINQVEVGQTVEVTCDSLEDMGTIEGVVTKVSVAGTTSNGVTTYPVTVQIDNPPDSLLPGMNVDAVIVVGEATDAVAVPVSAVQRGNIVYVKDDSATNTDGTMVNGTLLPDGWRAVEVETGLSDENYIEITSGITEGDIVYVPEIVRESSGEEGEMGMMPGGDMGGGMPSGDMGGGGMPAGGGGGGMPSGGGGGMP